MLRKVVKWFPSLTGYSSALKSARALHGVIQFFVEYIKNACKETGELGMYTPDYVPNNFIEAGVYKFGKIERTLNPVSTVQWEVKFIIERKLHF